MNPFKAILLVQSIIDGNEQEADLISSEEGFQTMLLLATYESQFTTYHFFTTLLVYIILSEKLMK